MTEKVHRLEVIGGNGLHNTTIRLDGKEISVSGVTIYVRANEYNSATLEFQKIETVVNIDVKQELTNVEEK